MTKKPSGGLHCSIRERCLLRQAAAAENPGEQGSVLCSENKLEVLFEEKRRK